MKEFSITFGALSPTIVKQLANQGLKIKSGYARRIQRLADAITLLAVSGVLSDTEKVRARRRLMGKIRAVIA